MGSIGGLLGTAGGVNGTGMSAPQAVPLQNASTVDQANTAYDGSQNSLASQQALLSALQGQNGIGNQGHLMGTSVALGDQLGDNHGAQNMGKVYGQSQALGKQLAANNGAANVGSAFKQSQGLADQFGKANGIGMQTGAASGLQGVASQQQGLANQLQGVANGTGPNPAQAMLNQETGKNVANQAALMAGQRGAGANVGLMARQAAQQGAATQQQAVGQGATMQANQSLGALGQLGAQQQAMAGTQGQIAGVGSGLTAQQQAQQQAVAGQAAQQVAQQQAQQQAMAGQAAAQVAAQQAQLQQSMAGANAQTAQQIGAINAASASQQAEQGQILQGLANQNTSAVNMQGNLNNANTTLANTNMQGQQAMIGGLMNSLGGGAASGGGPSMAQGGYVAKMAEGGETAPAVPEPAAPPPPGPLPVSEPPPGPQSSFGQFLAGRSSTGDYMEQATAEAPQSDFKQTPTQDTSANAQIQGPSQMGYGSQMLYKGASSAGTAAQNMMKMAPMAVAAAEGGIAKNRVPAMLSEKEIAIPPNVVNSSDPVKGSAAYVRNALKEGKTVKAQAPNQKAEKKGNSYDNDKIPASLPEGAIVIPRSVTQSKDPVRSSADFVAKTLAKRKRSAS